MERRGDRSGRHRTQQPAPQDTRLEDPGRSTRRAATVSASPVLRPLVESAQYTAGAFRAACRPLGITQSMGTVGDSYDNAMAESFFSGFKREVIDGEHFATRADARTEIFAWLNWYNRTRLHSSIGCCPPAEYEQHLAQQSLLA